MIMSVGSLECIFSMLYFHDLLLAKLGSMLDFTGGKRAWYTLFMHTPEILEIWIPWNATYHKVWLIISACTYHSQWWGNMRLLDDVCLIESNILAPPTASMFERSITKLASYEHSDSWKKLRNSSWKYDWKPSLEENRGKITDFFGETRFEVKVKSPNPSQWSITMLSLASFVQLAIRK